MSKEWWLEDLKEGAIVLEYEMDDYQNSVDLDRCRFYTRTCARIVEGRVSIWTESKWVDHPLLDERWCVDPVTGASFPLEKLNDLIVEFGVIE